MRVCYAPPSAREEAGSGYFRSTAFRRLLSSLVAACNAVAYAHSRGVLHRDLKPDNLMLGDFGETLVVDWGLAKVTAQGQPPEAGNATVVESVLAAASNTQDNPFADGTRVGNVVGTLQFMSPEQAAGDNYQLGPASDIFSLGAILYFLLTGSPPYNGSNRRRIRELARAAEFPRPKKLQPLVPKALEAVCLKAMAKAPPDRYASATELGAELERYLAGDAVAAHREGPLERVWRRVRRQPRAAGAVAAALCLAVGVLAVAVVWISSLNRDIRAANTVLVDTNQQLTKAREDARREADRARGAAAMAEREAQRAGLEASRANSESARARQELLRARSSVLTQQLAKFNQLIQSDAYAAARLLEDPSACPLDLHDLAWRYCRRLAERELKTLRWEGAPPSAVRYSPDGKLLAVSTFAGEVRLWNTATRETERTLKLDNRPIWGLAFSPDGTLLVAAVGAPPAQGHPQPGHVLIWGTESGMLLEKLAGHTDRVCGAAFSPDGKWLASGGADKTVRLWSTQDWQPKGTWSGHAQAVSTVVFAGPRLVSAGGDMLAAEPAKFGEIFIWDLATVVPGDVAPHSAPVAPAEAQAEQQAVPRKLEGLGADVTCLAWENQRGVLASAGRDGLVRLWHLDDRREPDVLKGHGSKITGLAFSPDGATLASVGLSGENDASSLQSGAGSIGEIRLWDVRRGSPSGILRGHVLMLTSIAFSPDGQQFATASIDGSVKLWCTKPGVPRRSIAASDRPARAVAVSPDGALLATANEVEKNAPGVIHLWSLPTGEPLCTLEGHAAEVMTLAFSSDGKFLASGSQDKTIRLWDTATHQTVKILEKHEDLVTTVQFARNQPLLASGSGDKTILLWDLNSGDPIAALTGHEKAVSSVAFSSDDAVLASGGYDDTVRLWNVADGNLLATLRGHAGTLWASVTSVAIAPDGRTLASGSFDQSAIIWNAEDGAVRYKLRGSDLPVSDVAFTSDGRTLVSASHDASVRMWDVVGGAQRVQIDIGQRGVSCLAILPGDSGFVAGTGTGSFEIYEVGGPLELATLRGHDLPPITAVAVAPDETWFATAAMDRTVRIWDVHTGQVRRVLTGHTSIMTALAFSAEGTLVSGSADKHVILWDVAKEQPRKKLATQMLVISVAVSPDGATVAAGGEQAQQGRIYVWRNGAEQPAQVLEGHPLAVSALGLTADGKTLAAAGMDHTLKLWDLDTGNEQAQLKQAQPIGLFVFVPAAISRSGRLVVSGGPDDGVQLWRRPAGMHALEQMRK